MKTRKEVLEYGLSLPDTYQDAPFHDPNWNLVRVRKNKKAFLWTYERNGQLCIALKLNGCTDMTERDDECELGYWLGKPFWGIGYMPEAAREILRHGFEDLGMTTIWCGYYDGNNKSKRVQEKVGFIYHHTCDEVPVPLMNEIRIGHTNYMTKERWKDIAARQI